MFSFFNSATIPQEPVYMFLMLDYPIENDSGYMRVPLKVVDSNGGFHVNDSAITVERGLYDISFSGIGVQTDVNSLTTLVLNDIHLENVNRCILHLKTGDTVRLVTSAKRLDKAELIIKRI